VGITDKDRHMKAEITNQLLKQAVADAEAVRDTAIANAKLALEESITPAIKSMLAARLRTEMEKPATHTPEEEKEGGPEGEEKEVGETPAADSKEMKKETLDSSDVGTGDNKQPYGFDTSDVGGEGEEAPSDAPDSEDDYYDDWDDSDFDLESIIKELEGDIVEDSLVEKEEAPEGEEGEEEVEDEVEEASYEAGHASPAGRMAPEKKEPATVDVPPMQNKKEEEPKFNLEDFIRELVAEAEDEDEEEAHPEAEKMAEEIATLKGELAEYREAVTLLRDKLQEVHLLNAKLLYTNKLFQKGKLSNEQAVRVLDSFDRAKTLREVKMVYALMVENIKAVRTEGRVPSRKTIVTEGLASRATASTAPKKEQLLEENSHIKRLQYLAGINS
jgi:hypothetical protein